MICILFATVAASMQLNAGGFEHLTPLRDAVKLSVSADRDVYFPRERIGLRIEAKNVSSHPVTGIFDISRSKRSFTLLHGSSTSNLVPILGLRDPERHWAAEVTTLEPGQTIVADVFVAVTEPFNRPQVGAAVLALPGTHVFQVRYADTTDPNGLLESAPLTVGVVQPTGMEADASSAFTTGLSYITQMERGRGFIGLSLQAEAESFINRFPQSRYTPPLRAHLASWLRYRDRIGETNEEEKGRLARVLVEDAVPPTISISVTPSVLWPPEKSMIPITVLVSASDGSGTVPVVRLVSIVCDDRCDPARDIAEASTGTDDREFKLRADRTGRLGGRTYTVTYEATDFAGNRATASAAVRVPHDQRKD
jgi:hypothetical protein